MTIAVEHLNIGTAQLDTSSTIVSFDTTEDVAAGSFIVIGVCWWGLNIGLDNIVDDAGGGGTSLYTWVVDNEGTVTDDYPGVGIARVLATTGLPSGTTITATLTSATTGKAIGGSSFTGVKATSPLDGTPPAEVQVSTAAWSSGNVALTAGSLLFAACHNEGASVTGNTPSAGSEAWESIEGNGFYGMVAGYRIEAGSGSYPISGTWNVAHKNITRAVAYLAEEGGTPPQVLTPSADSVDGAWTTDTGGTTLYAAIDEETPSDTDYIQSELSPNASGCRIKLEAGSDPNSSTGHEIHWRIGKSVAGGQTLNMTVKLYQGGGDTLGAGTLIASFNRNDVGVTMTDYIEPLSAGQADSITNYADLYLEFFATVA